MAKTRLNREKRDTLRRFVEATFVVDAKAQVAADKKIKAALCRVYNSIEKRYGADTPHEKKVLEKYGHMEELINNYRMIRIRPEGDNSGGHLNIGGKCHKHKEDTGRLSALVLPSSNANQSYFKVGQETYNAMKEADAEESELHQQVRKDRSAFFNVLEAVRYFEDCVEYWEGFEDIRHEVCATGTALAVVSQETRDRIAEATARLNK